MKSNEELGAKNKDLLEDNAELNNQIKTLKTSVKNALNEIERIIGE